MLIRSRLDQLPRLWARDSANIASFYFSRFLQLAKSHWFRLEENIDGARLAWRLCLTFLRTRLLRSLVC